MPVEPVVQPQYNSIEVVDDEALLSTGCTHLDPDRSDFLGQDVTDESIGGLDKDKPNKDEL